MSFRRAYIIQCVSTGEFLTPNDFWTKNLDRAGRVYDPQEARDTAEASISDGDFRIVSLWEGESDALPY